MPDSFFSPKPRQYDTQSTTAVSTATAFIEITGYRQILQDEDNNILSRFFQELSQEYYNLRRNNYNMGLRVIEPDISITGGRIQLSSKLFLEKNLPELSSFAFKLFVEVCNATMAVALKNDLPLKGMANIGENYKGSTYSGNIGKSAAKDTMVLSDLLEVFTFEEIFPEGFGQKIIPPVSIPFFYGKDLLEIERRFQEIDEAGIFMPLEILDTPATEIAVYSDMLIETKVSNHHMYECNWKSWIEKNPDSFDLDEILADLECLSRSESPNAAIWKKFVKRI